MTYKNKILCPILKKILIYHFNFHNIHFKNIYFSFLINIYFSFVINNAFPFTTLKRVVITTKTLNEII